MSMADELKKLQDLHASGALSDEEYAQAKARILNAPAPPAEPAPAAAPRTPRPPSPPRREPERKPPPPQSGSTNPGAMLPIMMVVIGLVVFAAIAGIFAFANMGLPFGGQKGGLTLKVDRVENRQDSFRIHMTATNTTKDTLRLPLFGYFFVTDENGNQYKADPFASTFPEDVAPGATVSGYAQMEKPLSPNATRLKVAFTTVFGSFAVKSASVDNVPVTRTE